MPVEYLLSRQWYIRMAPLAGAALEATRSGALVLEPTYWEKTWNHWLTQIEDWCVSRQLRWGHRIPVYTCARCEAVTAQVDAPTQCPACGGAVGDTLDLNCQYCGTPLNSTRNEWIVTGFVPAAEYPRGS